MGVPGARSLVFRKRCLTSQHVIVWEGPLEVCGWMLDSDLRVAQWRTAVSGRGVG